MNNGMLNTAVKAAQIAGKLILKNFEQAELQINEKQKNDLVTNVDKECEQAIKDFILSKYPTHRFLGEEGGIQQKELTEQEQRKLSHSSNDPNNDYLWIVDPIDGTANFVNGIPHIAVSIAMQINGRTELGVIFDPIRNELFKALRGQGCELDGRRLRVSDTPSLDGTIIATSFPHRRREYLTDYAKVLMRVLNDCADIRRCGTASLDLAYVAAGRCAGYFELGLKPWDLAAGELMVRESGGMVTDFLGGNDYYTSGHIICGNPKIVRGILAHAKDVAKNFR